MYEISLGLNIAWELALMYSPWTIPAIVVALVLLGVAIARPPRHSRRAAVLAAGTIGSVFAFFLLPGATMASFADMGYWVDWLVLLALSLAAGTVFSAAAAGVSALIPGGPPPQDP